LLLRPLVEPPYIVVGFAHDLVCRFAVTEKPFQFLFGESLADVEIGDERVDYKANAEGRNWLILPEVARS